MKSYIISVFYFSLIPTYVYSKEFDVAFPAEWNTCSTQEAFHKMANISYGKCELECMVRPYCQAVNYWRLHTVCEMMTMLAGDALVGNHPYCNYVSREQIKTEVKVPEGCKDCDAEEVCDIEDETCSKKECQRLIVENGDVLGNSMLQGDRAAVLCNNGYKLGTPVSRLICQENGNWSGMPTCLKDCRDPPELSNVVSVSAGDTTEGTTRTYECSYGHIVKKGGVKTTLTTGNATCDASGAWVVDFECVENCPDDWKLIGQSCYGFTQRVTSESLAKLACKAVDPDAHLATFHTKEEWEIVRSWTWSLQNSVFAFIDGKRIGTDIWKWSDGTPIETWGWKVGQPDNDNPTDCLYIKTGDMSFLLEDYKCDAGFNLDVFCERELAN